MRRRRHALQVSTFPFLAVLLCTMGSLILVLLVIDRRAKVVARAKAEQELASLVAEDSQAAAARQAEWERRRLELRALLEDEVRQVQDQVAQVARKSGDVAGSVQTAETSLAALRIKVKAEQENLAQGMKAVGAQANAVAEEGKKSQATQAALARMAANLEALERTLVDLKAARQRQQQTYSLVPYRGKHGDTRRPIYIECSARGLLFHPDRQALEGYDIAPLDIRREVEQRIARQRERLVRNGGKEQTPYILMLLRPSGIKNYYRTLGSLVGIDLDFGYEMIDEEWALDFSEDEETRDGSSWTTTQGLDLTRPSAGGGPRAGMAGAPGSGLPLGSSGSSGNGPGSSYGSVTRGGTGFGPPGGALGTGSGTGSPGGGVGTGSGTGSGSPGGVGTGVPGGAVGGGSGNGAPGTSFGPVRPGGGGGSTDQGTGTAGVGSGGPGSPTSGGGSGVAGHGSGTGGLTGPGGTGTAGPFRPGPGMGTGSGDGSGLVKLGTPGATSGDPGTQAGGPGASGSGTGSGGARGAGSGSAGGAAGTPGSGTSGTGTTQTAGTPGQASGTAATGGGEGNPSGAAGQPGSITIGMPQRTAPGSSGSSQAPPPENNNTGSRPPPTGEVTQGSGGSGSGSGDEPAGSFSRIAPPNLGNKPKYPPLPAKPVRMGPNRDWVIMLECTADAVVLPGGVQKVPRNSLGRPNDPNSPLLVAVRQMIERRQAALRPGEVPYQPHLRFLVQPDGLRTYYLAFPALEALKVPMTRANVNPDEEE